MTQKQYFINRFFQLLKEYKNALETGVGVVNASLAIHSAKSNVPKRYYKLVNQVFNDVKLQNKRLNAIK